MNVPITSRPWLVLLSVAVLALTAATVRATDYSSPFTWADSGGLGYGESWVAKFSADKNSGYMYVLGYEENYYAYAAAGVGPGSVQFDDDTTMNISISGHVKGVLTGSDGASAAAGYGINVYDKTSDEQVLNDGYDWYQTTDGDMNIDTDVSLSNVLQVHGRARLSRMDVRGSRRHDGPRPVLFLRGRLR